MNTLDWSKLQDSYSGFEKLAYRFISYKFPANWKHSQSTWDQNRDAYTVILGYQPYAASTEEWWMEAKYSTQKTNLSRYRLDATVVSAILEKNVTRVFFVTNIVISAKVMADIRASLISSIGCKEVLFFSKYTLEYWLSQNPDILSEFFPHYTEPPKIILEPYFVIEELEYYSEPEHQLSFKEPLQHLYKSKKYHGYFSVFSDKTRSISIKPAKHLKGIEVLSSRNIMLEKGENSIHIEFLIKDDFSSIKENRSAVVSFLFGKKEVLSKNNIIPQEGHTKIEIKEQENIKNDILKSLKAFCRKPEQQCELVTGCSGIGKSFIIDELLSSPELANENIYAVEFVDSSASNVDMIINSLLFMLFPYVSPLDIDEQYINQFKFDIGVSDTMKRFIQYKSNFEKIESLINDLNENSLLFSVKMSINRRILIYDDINKLKPSHLKFLCNIIEELRDKKLPVYVLLSGQPQILTDGFLPFKKKIYIKHYEYRLSSATVFKCINEIQSMDFVPNESVLGTIFPNLIELFTFMTYLKETEQKMDNMEDFIITCKLFQTSGVWEKSLKKIFKDLYFQNQKCFDVCANIYWSYSGIDVKKLKMQYDDEVEQLFKQNLIKRNKEGVLVPVHDVYTKRFRSQYPIRDCRIFDFIMNDAALLRDTICDAVNTEDVLNVVIKLETFCNELKFYTLSYVLDELFEQPNLDSIKNKLGESIFYRLYRLYALAATNISRKHSGRLLFEKIYKETIHSEDSSILLTCTSMIWELINSYYEWLDFEQSEFYASELAKLIKRLQRLNELDSDNNELILYHNMLVIQTLIESEQSLQHGEIGFKIRYKKMIEYGFRERAATFKIRYAHTLLFHDISKAKLLLQEGMEEIMKISNETHKFYMWAVTTCHFIDNITNTEPCSLKLLLDEHKKMKRHYYNDFRKRSIAIAMYFLSINDLDSAEKYLFDDITSERDLRPRQKGFYYEAMALYEAHKGQMASSLEYLENAERIFEGLAEYKKIILHNKRIVNDNLFSIHKIRFSYNNQLSPDYFCIDPRCIY